MESQQHGLQYEELVKERLSDILKYSEKNHSYTDEYDIPPFQIKSFKYSSKTIEFGSLQRMYEKNNNFILVLVGYQQKVGIKETVFSNSFYVTKSQLNDLRGDLTLEDVRALDQKLKTFGTGKHTDARKWAKEQKAFYNPKTNFDIRFKIDSKNQRRIQCAIGLEPLFKIMKIDFSFDNFLNIPDIESLPRKRAKNQLTPLDGAC